MGTQIKYSGYQEAIFNKIKQGIKNSSPVRIIIMAVAGSGKSFTIKICSTLTPSEDSTLFVAFNKHIVDGLKKILPKNVTCSTMHSLGYQACNTWIKSTGKYGRPFLQNDKYWKIIEDILENDAQIPKEKIKGRVRGVKEIVDMARCTLSVTEEAMVDMCLLYGIEVKEMEDYGHAVAALKVGVEQWKESKVLDFSDMIYLPYALDMKFPTYDWVFVDECLPHGIPILLSDGSSMNIGDIVDKKAKISVLTYNEKTKKQEPKRVVGWKRNLNNKPMVKISAWINHSKRNFIVCTLNHKIFTHNRGWVPAGEIKIGDILQIETSAKKTNKYKISAKGREVLANEMAYKNTYLPKINNKGYIPKNKQGGNGRSLTVPQKELLKILGDGWNAECIVPTGYHKDWTYPPHYKLDIGNQYLRIGIELDGQSHKSKTRKYEDNKKDDLLNRLGWKILRYENLEAIKNQDKILEDINNLICPDGGNCPIYSKVVSVEETYTKEYYTYDLEVEDNHNFYANGILVHNCQDLNSAQHYILNKVSTKNSSLIVVGDVSQSMYGFSGALTNSMDVLREKFNLEEMPLSICYRCPKSHVRLARMWDGNRTEWFEEKEEGDLQLLNYGALPSIVKSGDYILCRLTAPLVSLCIKLISNRINAMVLGRNIAKQITDLVSDIVRQYDWKNFGEHITSYFDERSSKWKETLKEGEANYKIQVLSDKIEAIKACYTSGRFSTGSERAFIADIESIFSDKEEGVILSTIHRTKGLEANRVFVLYDHNGKPTLPFYWDKQKEWEAEQEQNIGYVGFTRAKKSLTIVYQNETFKEELQSRYIHPALSSSSNPVSLVSNNPPRASNTDLQPSVTETVKQKENPLLPQEKPEEVVDKTIKKKLKQTNGIMRRKLKF